MSSSLTRRPVFSSSSSSSSLFLVSFCFLHFFLFIFGFPDEIFYRVFVPSLERVTEESRYRFRPDWLRSKRIDRRRGSERKKKDTLPCFFFVCLPSFADRRANAAASRHRRRRDWDLFFKMSGRKEGVFFFTFLLLLYELRKSFFFYP